MRPSSTFHVPDRLPEKLAGGSHRTGILPNQAYRRPFPATWGSSGSQKPWEGHMPERRSQYRSSSRENLGDHQNRAFQPDRAVPIERYCRMPPRDHRKVPGHYPVKRSLDRGTNKPWADQTSEDGIRAIG